MKKTFKRAIPVLIAGALAANCTLLSGLFQASAESVKYEFEDGTITGSAAVKSDNSSASGGSYVFLQDAGDTVSVTVPVETTGMYTINICYAAPYGSKIQNLYVNGVDQGQCSFEKIEDWTELGTGSVKLEAGDNTIMIKSSWGWTNFDYLTVEEAKLAEISASDTKCSDPAATAEADSLMSYLASVYGEHIISGQQEIYKYGPHDFEYEFKYIYDTTGKYPAIRGFDYLNCNPLYGSDDGTTDRIIEWVTNNPYSDNGGIATSSWHITVPKKFADYNIGDSVAWADSTYVPGETDFDPSKILEEGSKEREYYMLCLKGLAAELTKLQDANVPLIFRPLHEAEGSGGETGSWFWWGKAGSAVYKELWILTYETLTNEYGLHNLIWEWNSYAYKTSANWYPGDEYVDLIAYDKYNCTDWSSGSAVLSHNDSAISSTFYTIMETYGNKKMVAMSENDSIPALNNLLTEKAGWLYFCPWYDGGSDDTNFLTNEVFNTKADLTEMYQSDYCITLDELPADLYGNGVQGTGTKEPHVMTTTTTAELPDHDGIPAKIVNDSGIYKISFDRAIGDTIDLLFQNKSDIGYANGCVGISVNVDGTDYWVAYQWELDGTEEVTLSLTTPYEISYNAGTDKVTDEAEIAKISAAAQEKTSAEVQVWWANDSAGEEANTTDVVLIGAYLPDNGESSETKPAETSAPDEETTTATAAPAENDGIPAEIVDNNGIYDISFDRAIGDTVDLVFETKSDISYANGCIGISATVDGTDYWVSYKWEIDSTGKVTASLTDPFEISYNDGADTVTDEAEIEKISAAAKEKTSAQVQIWWANDSAGEAASTSDVVLVGAYLPDNGEVSETKPEETKPEETTEEETTTVEPKVTEEDTETEPVSTSPVSTQTVPAELPAASLYGDVNNDGKVDITDAVLLNKAAAKAVVLNVQGQANADCNANGEVGSDDAILLLRFLVRVIDKLPYTG